jgi:hypothetical protein
MSLWLRWCCVAALMGSASGSAAAQNRNWWGRPDTPDIVSHVEFDGNRRMSSQTLKAFIFTRPGDPYLGKDALGHDVIALRNTKHFTSVRLEVKDDPNRANAKIVIFHLIDQSPRPATNSR